MGPLPADYPPFLHSNCATGVWSRGGWGSVTEIAIRILGCEIPVVAPSWTAAKVLYQ